jgi:hypothetical protein
MSILRNMVVEGNPDIKWMARLGGISALAIGFGYVIIIGLFIPLGAPPSGAEAWLQYMTGNSRLWWAILGLSVLTDILFLPVALALYLALKGVNRSAMLLAVVCVVLFVLLDLAVTWTNYAVLITLSGEYGMASEVERAAIIATAQYPALVLDSSLLFVYNTLTLALGILIAGLVMLKGVFSKITAYLGLATGIFGIIAVAGSFFTRALDFATILASLFTLLWALFAGYDLIKIGRR